MISQTLSKRLRRMTNPSYLLKRTLETYRLITSPLRLLPEFLIIGVQKGGTTSLYRYLEQHPYVASAFVKEVHFFDNHTPAYNFGKGMKFYRSHFVYGMSSLYQQHLITGEGSPDYIFDLHAPKRIANCLPNVKLIILLRNPIDRAYSHYLHNVNAFWDIDREPLSFEDAIAAENTRLQGEREKLLQEDSYFSYNYMHYSYLSRGLYADQLKIWFSLFSREQILILRSEDFFDEPSLIFRQVLEFLQLPIWKLSDYKSFNTRKKNTNPINSDTRLQLVEYFRPHNERLSDLLKMDLNWDC